MVIETSQERLKLIHKLLSEGNSQRQVARILGVSQQNINQRLNKQKAVARKKVYDAVTYGEMIRPDSCINCYREIKVQAHHEDYTKPLDVL